MDENQFEDQFSSNEYYKWYEDYNFLNIFWTKFLKRGGTFINMPNSDLDILDQVDYLIQDYPNNNNFNEDIYLPDEIDAMNFFCDDDVSMILYKNAFDYVSLHLAGSNTNLVTLERIEATIGFTTASQGMTESNVGIATTNVKLYIQCTPEPINNLRFNVNTLNVGIGGDGNANIKGNVDIQGETDIAQDFRINTDKFTVDSSTGDTYIAGDLYVDGCVDVDIFCNYNWLVNYFGDSNTNLGIGTTIPQSKLSIAGTITEFYDGTYWNVVTQADIGIGASQVPLNQYLGQLAFLDAYAPIGLRSEGASEYDLQVFSNANIGIGTTNATSKLHVIGSTLITGITTVGLGTTSAPSNSQLTFELTSDTNLRIKVRGTDGVLRSANITLA